MMQPPQCASYRELSAKLRDNPHKIERVCCDTCSYGQSFRRSGYRVLLVRAPVTELRIDAGSRPVSILDDLDPLFVLLRTACGSEVGRPEPRTTALHCGSPSVALVIELLLGGATGRGVSYASLLQSGVQTSRFTRKKLLGAQRAGSQAFAIRQQTLSKRKERTVCRACTLRISLSTRATMVVLARLARAAEGKMLGRLLGDKTLACAFVSLSLFASLPSAQADATCASIADGTIFNSQGDALSEGPDEWGYDYDQHMFHGGYCASKRNAPSCMAYAAVDLTMTWNDAWLSNTDCDGDGLLDRHFGFAAYRGSGAELANYMHGRYTDSGMVCDWYNVQKMVAAPLDATLVNGVWKNADGTALGPTIWGEFAVTDNQMFYICPDPTES
jgi:hypothetical protein